MLTITNILTSTIINRKDFISKCNSVNNSKLDYDVTDNDLSTVNSKYYDLKQLNSLEIDLPSCFGLFHVNTSLDNHFDDLRLILSLLNYNFDVIVISEHNIMKDTLPINNI